MIDRYLAYRAQEMTDYKRNFGPDAEDPQNSFILLDDCVDQKTRFDAVRFTSC